MYLKKGLNRQVIIPARNEARAIRNVVNDAQAYVGQVLVIDDASTDDTAQQAKIAGATVITNEIQLGYLKSLKSRVNASTGATIVFLDADGEHDPADIPQLVAPIEAGTADMFFGTPGRSVRWSEGVISRLARLRMPIHDSGFGYRALSGELARQIPFRGRCGCGLMALDAQKLGARLLEVPVGWLPVVKKRRRSWCHLIHFGWVIRGLAGM